MTIVNGRTRAALVCVVLALGGAACGGSTGPAATFVSYQRNVSSTFPGNTYSHVWTIAASGDVTSERCSGTATAAQLAPFVAVATSPSVVDLFVQPGACLTADGGDTITFEYVGLTTYPKSRFCGADLDAVTAAADRLFAAVCP